MNKKFEIINKNKKNYCSKIIQIKKYEYCIKLF